MARQRKTIRLSASVPYHTYSRDGWECARCDLLGVTGVGKTRRAALKNLRDSITLLLQGAIEDGQFPEFMKACGLMEHRVAGVPIWEPKSAPRKKFANQELLSFLTTLRPNWGSGGPERIKDAERWNVPLLLLAMNRTGIGSHLRP